MTHAIEIGYVNVEVSDPGGFATFLTDIIGLTPSEPTPTGEATWTDDAAVQRVIVSDGPRNDLAAVGFEAVDVAAFDATIERLGASGFGVETADGPLVAARRVERMAVADAPWGTPVEVCVGLERTARARSPLMTGGFRTEGQGFGHAVIATTAFDESVRFVIEGLGMAESDWLLTEIAEGIQLEVRFFHCNARHHSLALARAPFELPQRLHHLMFETNERDDVGRAYDRAFDGGLELPNGLGRHDNDGMFSFYVASPAGFQIEVGHGARQITEPWADDRQYDRISAWGHQPISPR